MVLSPHREASASRFPSSGGSDPRHGGATRLRHEEVTAMSEMMIPVSDHEDAADDSKSDVPPRPEAIRGRTFHDVLELVRERASRNLPDVVVHVEKLRAAADGTI